MSQNLDYSSPSSLNMPTLVIELFTFKTLKHLIQIDIMINRKIQVLLNHQNTNIIKSSIFGHLLQLAVKK